MHRKLLGGVAALALATAAIASVTFDPNTGTGFVGKGDVQIPFGWNNAQLQNNAAGVTFRFENVENYAATCVWVTGEGTRGEKTHTITQTASVGVLAALDGDPRQVKGQKQFTGFILKGFNGTPTVTGTVPLVGGVCPGQGTDGTWTLVSLVGSNVGLYAVYNGVSIKIWPPAVAL